MNPGILQQGSLPVATPFGLLGKPQPIPTPNQWSGGFDPTLVGTLTAWYDFSDQYTLTLVNGLISSILNKSGSAPTLTQSVEANRPAIGQINGRTAASFDGSNDVLFSATATAGRGTAFAVLGDPLGIDKSAVFFCASAGGVEALSVGTNNTAANLGTAGRWSGAGGYNASVTCSHARHSAYILATTFNRSAAPQVRVNGAFQAALSGGVNNGNFANTAIGASNTNGTYVRYWPSTIGEVLLYSSVLAGDQIFAVSQYLSKKWGIPS